MTIDWWTLGVQSVNIVVLIWLLRRFFWAPVAAMIETRRESAEQILSDASSKQVAASAALAEIEKTRTGFSKEREAALTTAREGAEQERRAILARAADEAEATRRAAETAIAAKLEADRRVWSERAARLAVEIAERLAARLRGPGVEAAFLDWLLAEIRALPEAAKGVAAREEDALLATSAAAISPADQQRYREAIGEALGAPRPIEFQVDASLIAGLELTGPHFAIRNSWRADLSRILQEVSLDGRR